MHVETAEQLRKSSARDSEVGGVGNFRRKHELISGVKCCLQFNQSKSRTRIISTLTIMLYLTSKIQVTVGGCTETLMCAVFLLSLPPFCLSTFYVVTAAATFYPLRHNSNAHSAIIYFVYDALFETDRVTNIFDVFVSCL
jgi:hypothetical protein